MKNSIKILISEYTILSIIVHTFLPVYLYATEENVVDFGSNNLISNQDTPTPIKEDIPSNDEVIISGEETPVDTYSGEETPVEILPIDPIDSSTGDNTPPVEPIPTEESLLEVEKAPEVENIEIPEEKIPDEETPEIQDEGDILVKFKSDITSSLGEYRVQQIASNLALVTTDIIPEDNIAIMQSSASRELSQLIQYEEGINVYNTEDIDQSQQEIIEELKKDPSIEHVQKNFIYEISTTNDPDYTKLWGLDNQGQTINGTAGIVDADLDYTEAVDYSSGKLGTNTIVAVLDTGIAYNHPDLIGNMWNGTNCVSDTGSILGGCIHGYDFVNNDNNPNDGHYHGTHVAGTIGAVTNNNIGLNGVSPNVRLMAVKILDDKGRGSTASIIRGINFAKNNGAKIINASFGGVEQINSESEFDYLSYNAIKDFPGLFVAASGNDGSNLELQKNTKNFPSGFSSDTIVSGEVVVGNTRTLSGNVTIPGLLNVISVAATTQNDTLASFSNYGTGTVDIAAPGTNTWSSIPLYSIQSGSTDSIKTSNGWTKNNTGTLDNWEVRPGITISGETIDLSNAVWGNTKTPYVSGEVTYIEKSYGTLSGAIGSIGLNIWCDTPTSNVYKDYIDVLISTGGTYQSIKKIDEDIINFSQGKTLIVNGYTGKYQRYNITSALLNNLGNASISIRILWKTDGLDDIENTLPHYGCAVENLNFNTMNVSYDYKYSNGTSMAAPHVAGVAAMGWSYKINASISEIKSAIINGGDTKSSLINSIKSGKRLNALGMLQNLDSPMPIQPALLDHRITLSGGSSAIIEYKSNIGVTSEILYATGITTVLSGGIQRKAVSGEIQSDNTIHKAILTELLPDTQYYYRITLTGFTGSLTNSEFYEVYTFLTPKVTTSQLNTAIIVSGEIYFSGATSSGISMSGSSQSGLIVLQSNPAKIKTTLPVYQLDILSTSGSWNGILSAPRVENTGGIISLSGNTSINSQLLFSLGNTTNSLVLSGQVATIEIEQIQAQSGQIISIYYTPNIGTRFIKISECVVINNTCRFNSQYLGLFALGLTQTPPVTPPVTPVPSCTISINPNSVINGSGATLSWTMINALTGTINPGNLLVGSSGSTVIIPPINATTPYVLTVTNPAGTSSCTASVVSAPVVVVPPVTPPVTPPTGGNGGVSVGPGGGGGGGGSSSYIGASVIQNHQNTTLPILPIENSLTPTKPSFRKVIPEKNKLYIQIRSLQAKLNKNTITGENRRNTIIELQEFYKKQLLLMRSGRSQI